MAFLPISIAERQITFHLWIVIDATKKIDAGKTGSMPVVKKKTFVFLDMSSAGVTASEILHQQNKNLCQYRS